MKTHSYLSFFKGASLAGLGLAALSLTCLGLTSCGGGGEEDGTDVGKVAKFLQGRTVRLVGAVTCEIRVEDAPSGSRVLTSRAKFGGDTEQPCFVTVLTAAPMTEDDVVTAATLSFSAYEKTLFEGKNFLMWWGQPDGYRSMTPVMPQIVLSNGVKFAEGCQGDFTATCESFSATDGNGAEVATADKDLPTAGGIWQIVQD